MTDNLLAGRRILIVEDEMLILLKIEDMLSDLGCQSVSAASNVEKALELIHAEAFDAAMVDVNLDGKKSYAVADALATGGVPFVFSTGYSGESLKDGYRDRPMLQKPYRDSELAAMFSRLLRTPAKPDGVIAS